MIVMAARPTETLGSKYPDDPELPRNQHRKTSLFPTLDCTGETILEIKQFKCGEHCWRFNESMSILMEGTIAIAPWAFLYSDGNCGMNAYGERYKDYPDQIASVRKFHRKGCTNADARKKSWKSVRLFWDCPI
jgi:hypothetical protein